VADQELGGGRMQALLAGLARLCLRRWGAILLLWVLLTTVFALFATRLQQKTTIKDLLPEDNQVVMRFETTVRDFQLIDRIVVGIETQPEDLELAQSFADHFVESVRSDDQFPKYLRWINANLFDQIKESDYYRYLEYLPRMLPPEKVAEFCSRLAGENIEKRIQQNLRDLESGMASKTLIEKDPLGLLDLAVSYKDEITGNYSLDLAGGYLTSKDQTFLLVLARPIESNENVDFAVAAMDFLKTHLERARTSFAEEEGSEALDRLKVGITGAHAITSTENATIKADVYSMFLSSFAMVILLFIVAYGRPMALLYVGVPLVFSEIWTLGISYFLFGRLNLLTATFSAVIVGLGIDFAIHIYSRFLDERAHGCEPGPAMERALGQTGLGTLVAGMTTALAFLAMGIGHFKGLFEFSVISSLGIALCMLHMFILLPCMIFMRESLRRKPWKERVQYHFLTDSLVKTVVRSGRLGLLGFALLTALMLFFALDIRFNPDLRSIRARSNPAIELQSRITSKVGGSIRSMTFVMESADEDGLYRMHQQLQPILANLRAEGLVVRFDTALNFIQEPNSQRRNIETLEQAELTAEGFKEHFHASLAKAGFRRTADLDAYAEHLALGLEGRQTISLNELLASEGGLLRQFLMIKEGRYRAVAYVYPARGLWEKKATAALAQRILDGVQLQPRDEFFMTGLQVLSDEIKALVEDSFLLSTLLSFSLVSLVLVFHFRKLPLILLVLTPLLAAIIWMLGTLSLLGIDINLLNFVATPLIIGIGIDDGVHILEKYLQRSHGDVSQTVCSCAKAVTLTSLTTVFGFSSLFLAKYTGFHSLGLSAILGVGFAWLASITLLPLLLETLTIRYVRRDS
jgi:predicted RND superfamily exporter protein